ncbi:MAG TPA: amidohydrolase family protein, partial [Acidimicrobiales bacterium]|nr:amidohydrolase family protein [Acidimicrobiales bacterium]
GADDLPEPHGPVGIERAGDRLGLVRELELLVEVGASPGVALQAATVNVAWAVGRCGELGTVEAGKLADLLVIDGDPLADLGALERPLRVFKNGRQLSRS